MGGIPTILPEIDYFGVDHVKSADERGREELRRRCLLLVLHPACLRMQIAVTCTCVCRV